MASYFKILNQSRKHYNHQYIDGLNVLSGELNENPNHTCCKGGFYFTTLEHIHEFYDYGCDLVEIFLPTNDPEFKMVKDPEGNKWRSNKVILGNKYHLNDLATFERFNLSVAQYSMDLASKNNYINILNWWKASGLKLNYESYAMNEASANGHVEALQWWLNSNLELKYTEFAINEASRKGFVNILQWWRNSELELKYDNQAMNEASANGHTKILQWWTESALKLKFDRSGMNWAYDYGRTDTLRWWEHSKLI